MNDDELPEVIHCDEHGEAYPTFICRHLITGESTEWFSAEPIEEDPWPHAWCSICHEHFLAEGEWNEKSEEDADIAEVIQILCHCCYEDAKSECDVNYIE